MASFKARGQYPTNPPCHVQVENAVDCRTADNSSLAKHHLRLRRLAKYFNGMASKYQIKQESLKQKKFPILDLPPELQTHFLSVLDYKTLMRLQATSKHFRDLPSKKTLAAALLAFEKECTDYYADYYDQSRCPLPLCLGGYRVCYTCVRGLPLSRFTEEQKFVYRYWGAQDASQRVCVDCEGPAKQELMATEARARMLLEALREQGKVYRAFV